MHGSKFSVDEVCRSICRVVKSKDASIVGTWQPRYLHGHCRSVSVLKFVTQFESGHARIILRLNIVKVIMRLVFPPIAFMSAYMVLCSRSCTATLPYFRLFVQHTWLEPPRGMLHLTTISVSSRQRFMCLAASMLTGLPISTIILETMMAIVLGPFAYVQAISTQIFFQKVIT